MCLRAEPDLDAAIAHFTADDFDDTLSGVNQVAASGSPRAETILHALQASQLMFSAEKKQVYIRDNAGKLTDAATGAAISGEPPGDLDNVNVNNRVRSALDAAMGTLSLFSADPNKRFDAAQAVFKSRDGTASTKLDSVIAKEQDPKVKKALEQARAAIALNSADATQADQLAAVAIIRMRGDQDALAVLSSLPGGRFTVVAAANAGVAAIQRRLAIWDAVQNAWYGCSLGSVLLLAAIGLAITFRVMGVINMAHGEMVMLGAYVTYVVQELIRTNTP